MRLSLSKNMKKIAAISDVHGCVDELKSLYNALCYLSLDAIWHVGDLLDRGPDSGGVVAFCRENGIQGVCGNHEHSILSRIKSQANKQNVIFNPAKDQTIAQLSEADIEYLKDLPRLHVFDDLNTVLVHGGLWPVLPLWAQPFSIHHLQLIHKHRYPDSRWWGYDKVHDRTEEQNTADGWHRWYTVHNGAQRIVYGHSVFREPMVVNNTYGIDTGCVYGGKLTAAIISDVEEVKFVQVPAKQAYLIRDPRL